MANLIPCPFCGKDTAVILKEPIFSEGTVYGFQYQVICDMHNDGCGASAGYRDTISEAKEAWNRRNDISALPAADVQPVIETENMATVSDEFICKNCGIYLIDYSKVVMDEDSDGYIDKLHYEYEPKFCPECGAKIVEEDKK